MKALNLSIVTKIYLGFGLLCSMLATLGVIFFILTRGIGDRLDDIVKDANIAKAYSSQISENLLRTGRYNTSLVSAKSLEGVNQSYQQYTDTISQVELDIQALTEHLKQYNHLEDNQKNLQLLSTAIAQLNTVTKSNLDQKTQILATAKIIGEELNMFLNMSATLKRDSSRLVRDMASNDLYISDLSILVNERFALIEFLLMHLLNTEDTEVMNSALKKIRYYAKQLSDDMDTLISEVEALNTPAVLKSQKTFLFEITDKNGIINRHIQNQFNINSLEQSLAKLLDVAESLDISLQQIDQYVGSLITSASEKSIRSISVANITILSVVPISLIIGLLVSILLGRALSGPLHQVMEYLRILADGDYSQPLTRRYSGEFAILRDCLNTLQQNTVAVLEQLHTSAEQLAKVSAANSHSASEVDHKIQQQSAEITSVATAVTQMEAAIKEVAENTNQSKELANLGEQDVDNGLTVMTSNIETMDQLEQQIQDSSEVIKAVAEYSREIGSILDVINAISDKTNLLALNAAIEAARAGEHGRGFAVVADEVRSLASQTAKSTETIHNMISRLQNESGSAVNAMAKSLKDMTGSKQQVNEAGDKMSAIRAKMHEMGDMADQISVAAQEQHHVAQEVSKNINIISSVADDNATLIEAVAQNGNQLQQLAVKLEEVIKQFKIR